MNRERSSLRPPETRYPKLQGVRPISSRDMRPKPLFRKILSSKTAVSRSVLDYVTGAEGIEDSDFFSSGEKLTLLSNNLNHDHKHFLSASHAEERGFKGAEKKTSVTVDAFLNHWETTLETRDDATQYIA
jgi:hypothetical protein